MRTFGSYQTIMWGGIAVAAAAATRAVASVISSNSSDQPMPRLVSSGAPTIEEAKQATSELHDALQTIYLSPNNTQRLEDSVPNPTLQAFRLLQDIPAAQNLVATLVSDPNVWDAVTQTNVFNDFIRKYKTTAALPTLYDWLVCNEIPSPKGGKGFVGKLLEMGLSEFIQGLFAGHLWRNGDGTIAEKAAFESTLMALVSMVIMAIVLKQQPQA